MILAVLAATLQLWQGEKLYHFGPVESPLVVRRGAIASIGGHSDKVVWGQGDDVAEIVANVPPGRYGEVAVLPRSMPPLGKSDYFLDLWQHPWAVARTAKVEPFSPAHYAAMRPLWEQLADAGQKCLTVTLIDLPWNHQCYDGYGTMVQATKLGEGEWRYDYTLFDEYVEFGQNCGLGPYISCWTLCPWGYLHRWRDAAGNEVVRELRPGTAEYAAFWTPYLKSLDAHLTQKGWRERVFIALDERSPGDVAAVAALVGEVAPGLKLQMAGNRRAGDFGDTEIAYYSGALEYVDGDFERWATERRARGLKTTCYVCCVPERPNTFIDSPREEALYLGAYPASHGLDGFLRWAYNSWPENPDLDAAFGNWPAGDTFLVYPDGSPSVRFLALRNGISAAVKRQLVSGEEVKR